MAAIRLSTIAVVTIMLQACGSQSEAGIPMTPELLQSIASEGCRCMRVDPQHAWWTVAENRDGGTVPACWAEFDKAVAGLDVIEEPVAADGPGSEAAMLTVSGKGMPPEGATIYLRYAFDGCTRSEADERATDFKSRNASGD